MAKSALMHARQLRRDALTEEILDAAWELASGRGLRGLSLRALAEMLHIDHQRIYTHFQSKRDLYRSLFLRRFPAPPEEWAAVGIDVGRVRATAAEGPPAGTRRRARASSRPPTTAVDAIDRCTAEAVLRGHRLGGFVRQCHTATYSFTARCRICGDEVSVRRTPAGWIRASDPAPCGS